MHRPAVHLSWAPALRLLAVRNPGRNQDALCRSNVGAFWPRLFGMPRLALPNPTACALGENCKTVMAFRTFVLVAADTSPVRLKTRDTVAVETPARRATSLTVQDRCSIPAGVLVIVSRIRQSGDRFPIPVPFIARRHFDLCTPLLEIVNQRANGMNASEV